MRTVRPTGRAAPVLRCRPPCHAAAPPRLRASARRAQRALRRSAKLSDLACVNPLPPASRDDRVGHFFAVADDFTPTLPTPYAALHTRLPLARRIRRSAVAADESHSLLDGDSNSREVRYGRRQGALRGTRHSRGSASRFVVTTSPGNADWDPAASGTTLRCWRATRDCDGPSRAIPGLASSMTPTSLSRRIMRSVRGVMPASRSGSWEQETVAAHRAPGWMQAQAWSGSLMSDMSIDAAFGLEMLEAAHGRRQSRTYASSPLAHQVTAHRWDTRSVSPQLRATPFTIAPGTTFHPTRICLTVSVMATSPNIALRGQTQGDYHQMTLVRGLLGHRISLQAPVCGSTDAELPELHKSRPRADPMLSTVPTGCRFTLAVAVELRSLVTAAISGAIRWGLQHRGSSCVSWGAREETQETGDVYRAAAAPGGLGHAGRRCWISRAIHRGVYHIAITSRCG